MSRLLDLAPKLGLIVRRIHAHDSRPGSVCATVALTARGPVVHINVDGHQLDPLLRTLWHSSRPLDPPATAYTDGDALGVAVAMLRGEWVSCDWCGKYAEQSGSLNGRRFTRCDEHAVVLVDPTQLDQVARFHDQGDDQEPF